MSLFPIPFVPLKEHTFALAAVRHAARSRRAVPAVVYIWGASGVGKTALLNALAENRQMEDPTTLLLHIEATDLLRPRPDVAGPSADSIDADSQFPTQLLVCDNLHRLLARDSAQRQLIRFIDAATAGGGIVVLSGLRPLGEIGGLSPRLLNRCRAGVSVRLEPPDADGRRALIEAFCARRRIPLDPQSVPVLTEFLPAIPRELFAGLMDLESMAVAQNLTNLTAEFVRSHLAGPEHVAHRPTIPAVAQAAAREFGLPLALLRGESRKAAVSRARRMAMSLCRELTGASLTAIGTYFNDRSHSAVKHACEVLARDVRSSAEAAARLRRLQEGLASRGTAGRNP